MKRTAKSMKRWRRTIHALSLLCLLSMTIGPTACRKPPVTPYIDPTRTVQILDGQRLTAPAEHITRLQDYKARLEARCGSIVDVKPREGDITPAADPSFVVVRIAYYRRLLRAINTLEACVARRKE